MGSGLPSSVRRPLPWLGRPARSFAATSRFVGALGQDAQATRRIAAPLALLVGLFLIGSVSAAEGPSTDGITVPGTGQVKGRPTLVEISASVSGEAELTADAIVKYRDARKRGVEAIENLKIPGLTVESEGFSINQAVDENARQMAMRGMMVASGGKQKVSVSERLKLVLKDAEKMETDALMDAVLKVIDTGRDAGLTVGPGTPVNYNVYPPPPPPALISFKIPDLDALRTQAYEKAMEDARQRAQRLADLAGVKLGRIASVTDGGAMPQQQRNQPYYMYYNPPAQNEVEELSSTMLGEIPLTVKLTVQFEIEPKVAGQAAAAKP